MSCIRNQSILRATGASYNLELMLNRRSFLSAVPLATALAGQKPAGVTAHPTGVWDVHTHLAGVPGDTPEAIAGGLVRFADRMGIERLVVFMGNPFHVDPTPEELRAENDQVLRAVRAFPDRIFGFVYLSPNQVACSLQELDRCVRDGPMVGVKLWVAKRCNAPELDPIVERAAALRTVVLQHTYMKITGNLAGESVPSDLAELARRHPTVPLIAAHTGADWEQGIRAVRATKNVAVDVCGFDPTAGVVEMAVRELGAERVLYGSDAGLRTFASQLAKVMGADIPESARSLILGGNLKRMLAPILKAKGYKL
jgi:uncharacterized protein